MCRIEINPASYELCHITKHGKTMTLLKTISIYINVRCTSFLHTNIDIILLNIASALTTHKSPKK